jgi:hypothetical protein
VAWVLITERHAVPGGGDASYFFVQAKLIVNGTGVFIAPSQYVASHVVLQSAQHPPLWTLTLVAADAIGLNSYLSHLLVACLVGAAAVFVTGLAAREVAGPRVGLIAAAIAAVYPNYWLDVGTGLSETLLKLLVAAVVFASYRFWHRPTLPRAVWLGALCALAALTRAEQVSLVILVLVPVALVLRTVPMRRRLTCAGVGVVTVLFILAPWVGFNLARFSHRVFISDDLGGTLAGANCRTSYHGQLLGFQDFACVTAIKPVPGDESAEDAHLSHVALHYIEGNVSRLPVVMAARVGRELGFYAPMQQLSFDALFSGRPLVPLEAGLYTYYGLLLGGVYGALVLRRRGITLVPFVGLLVETVATAMLFFGQTRYRAPLEMVLVVLAAVALDALVTRLAGAASGDAPQTTADSAA